MSSKSTVVLAARVKNETKEILDNEAKCMGITTPQLLNLFAQTIKTHNEDYVEWLNTGGWVAQFKKEPILSKDDKEARYVTEYVKADSEEQDEESGDGEDL